MSKARFDSTEPGCHLDLNDPRHDEYNAAVIAGWSTMDNDAKHRVRLNGGSVRVECFPHRNCVGDRT